MEFQLNEKQKYLAFGVLFSTNRMSLSQKYRLCELYLYASLIISTSNIQSLQFQHQLIIDCSQFQMRVNLHKLSPQNNKKGKKNIQVIKKDDNPNLSALEELLNSLHLSPSQIQHLHNLSQLHGSLTNIDSNLRDLNSQVWMKKQKNSPDNTSDSFTKRAIQNIINHTHSLNKKIQNLQENQSKIEKTVNQLRMQQKQAYSKDLDQICSQFTQRTQQKINHIKQINFGISSQKQRIIDHLKNSTNKLKSSQRVQQYYTYLGMLQVMKQNMRDSKIRKLIEKQVATNNNTLLFCTEGVQTQPQKQIQKKVQVGYIQMELQTINKEIGEEFSNIKANYQILDDNFIDCKETQLCFKKIYADSQAFQFKIKGCKNYFEKQLNRIQQSTIFSKGHKIKSINDSTDPKIQLAKKKMRQKCKRWQQLNKQLIFCFNMC